MTDDVRIPPAPPPPPGPAPAPRSVPAARGGGVTASSLQTQILARTLRAEQANLPPVAYSFRVVFAENGMKDENSFQEVSGIGGEMQVEEVIEGGETRFVHRLPTGVKYKPLVLKRGVAPAGSALAKWCRATLEGGLGRQILTVPLTVYLLDEEGNPLRAWLFADAYPTQWEIGNFDAMNNAVAIETITLSYTYSTRLL